MCLVPIESPENHRNMQNCPKNQRNMKNCKENITLKQYLN